MVKFWRSTTGQRFAKGFINDKIAKGELGGEWDGRILADKEAHDLDRAESYWVAPDMVTLVEHAAKTMPVQPLKDTDLPTRSGFVILDKCFYVKDVREQTIAVKAILWSPTRIRTNTSADDVVSHASLGALGAPEPTTMLDGIQLSFYTDPFDSRDHMYEDYVSTKSRDEQLELRQVMGDFVLLGFGGWAFGLDYVESLEYKVDADAPTAVVIPEGTEPDQEVGFVHKTEADMRRFMAAFWTLLSQPIAVTERKYPDRAAARRLKRGGLLENIDGVKIVVLRKRYETDDHDREIAIPGSVEWSRRWIVDGHWRNQWVPSINGHRLTYIAPYIKGPEDKPLIVQNKVYAWKR